MHLLRVFTHQVAMCGEHGPPGCARGGLCGDGVHPLGPLTLGPVAGVLDPGDTCHQSFPAGKKLSVSLCPCSSGCFQDQGG